MRIRRKKVGRDAYFYLEHSFRIEGKVKKKEIYLGRSIPGDIETIKLELNHQIMQEQYFEQFVAIKKSFSKELDAMPLSAREKYLDYFMIKFTYDTNRIEGSTITLKETAKILEQGITPENKPISDVKEIESHRNVFRDMINHEKDISMLTILKWHRMLLKDTNPDVAGKIRRHQVKVAGSKAEFPIPAELNILLEEFIEWYRKNKKKLHPIELAVLTHLKFVSIHPFTDGNGRISRILMNFILHRHGYPMLNIKYSNRDSYYNALERAQVKDQEKIFTSHIFRRYLKEYKKYAKMKI
ncbi:Fic family protein [Candidatus Woesearchaeota archaeon]|nr:Fic family protein [Candidatus Woesearchaeota archaeon]